MDSNRQYHSRDEKLELPTLRSGKRFRTSILLTQNQKITRQQIFRHVSVY